MASPEPEIVVTSVWKHLVARMNAIHAHRWMGAFAGPPGIGKSTAIDSFSHEHPGRVAVVRVRQPGARPGLVASAVTSAVRDTCGVDGGYLPTGMRVIERALDSALAEWANRAWRDSSPKIDQPNLTIIVDEAQTLSPAAIEMMRFLNDGADGLYPIGVIFIGNHEFRLEDGAAGPSFLSAAVESRTSYRKTFTYQDLTDDDLALIIDARVRIEPTALELLIRHCRMRRANRDLRQLGFQLDEMADEAGEAAITPDVVRSVLGLS